MLSLFARRSRPARPLTVVSADASSSATDPAAATPPGACPLAACAPGARATVLALCCGHQEACRLRALGFSEGTQVDVVDARHAMLLDVRGTRLALGRALTAGITVQPHAAG
ncbi:FeoA family protein [Roseisolibacter sp. H3M3-2]|uniref:FeoA family protein n=1 Tax=Roseisolibacter sp. H3M3-2 TaxID=3031323 RepID=UPI0023DAA4D7|nr:FeoA family protein [Roseisolibacter sp. H3M3-2]MDF1503873.1 FeoA family protein [Roseisolibacter sp. H3M3-2]